jgi:hypothetical protein
VAKSQNRVKFKLRRAQGVGCKLHENSAFQYFDPTGISNNTRAFWSLVNARVVLGYAPEDDSEVVFAQEIQRLLMGQGTPGSRVGL